MVKLNVCLSTLFALIMMASSVSAQEIYDPNMDRPEKSLRPIRYADQMFKKTVWRSMDLKTKINEPFYAEANELPKIIIDAVKQGLIRPYRNDSMSLPRMSMDDFLANLQLPGGGGDDDDWGDDEDDGWDDEGEGDEGDGGGAASNEYFARQMSVMEIREDLIFDRKRSRWYYDIQAITIILPASETPNGVDKIIGTFSYKELVENVFKGNPDAIWYNPENSADFRNLADAFELRLFDSKLMKYNNPKDRFFTDIYPDQDKMAHGKSEEYDYDLIEYENNLWSN